MINTRELTQNPAMMAAAGIIAALALICAIVVGAVLLIDTSESTASSTAEKPAVVTAIEGSDGLSTITLTEKAAERTGIVVTAVEATADGLAIPYSAIMYETDGDAYVYIETEPRTYVREAIVVDRIDGELALLSDGPDAGTNVVTVGSAELQGAEFGVGK
jgi:hypothetical protein